MLHQDSVSRESVIPHSGIPDMPRPSAPFDFSGRSEGFPHSGTPPVSLQIPRAESGADAKIRLREKLPSFPCFESALQGRVQPFPSLPRDISSLILPADRRDPGSVNPASSARVRTSDKCDSAVSQRICLLQNLPMLAGDPIKHLDAVGGFVIPDRIFAPQIENPHNSDWFLSVLENPRCEVCGSVSWIHNLSGELCPRHVSAFPEECLSLR